MNVTTSAETMYRIMCRSCGQEQSETSYVRQCACGGMVEFRYDNAPVIDPAASWTKSMWRYGSTLPVRDRQSIVSLGEGSTPLERAVSFPDGNVFLKLENANPTGSHKDRMLSVGISKAREFGFRTVLLYSDGSTGLASAAYAAKAGLKNIVLTPEGAPKSRLLPLALYGSTILEYRGGSAEALEWVRVACAQYGLFETSTYRRANPYEGEGAKTISYEIVEQLGRAPDWLVVPVGGGGTLAGMWRGFQELAAHGMIARVPKLLGVIPQGYNLLPDALQAGLETEEQLLRLVRSDEPATIQVKISMPWPPDGGDVLAAIRESGGLLVQIPDEEAMEAVRQLAAREGVYTEPSAAVAMAATGRLRKMDDGAEKGVVVALISGSGFRETEAIGALCAFERTIITGTGGVKQIEETLAKL